MAPTDTNARSPSTRIAFCITDLDPGGAERCLFELATRIDRRRFEPVVYCLARRPAGNPTSLADELEQAGIAVRCFGAGGWIALPKLVRRLGRQLIEDRPQIVQTFLFHANVIGARAARRAGVERVVSGIRVAERRSVWHLVVARWADRWADRHVCVSQSVRDFSLSRGYLPADKLLVIPNGVDVERFAAAQGASPASLALPAGRRAIACIGRLEEQKGVDWLLETMRPLFTQMPEHDLVLVGDGPLRAELEALAARLGISERVHFVGFRSDVAEILAASDLLVLPSRWEGMPNVVLEAMAAGRPVVATDVSGVTEALGGGAQEQVAPGNDPREFARKVAAILGQGELAARLGRENQARARAEFPLAAMVTAYERLYGALLSPEL
jgi:glycosyltransferase involved in cell wall biosynthesis